MLAITLRALHDENLLDYSLKSAHILDVFITYISGLLGFQERELSAKALLTKITLPIRLGH